MLALQGGGNNFGRGKPNTLVGDFHTAIACAHGDLFGTVGMAVQPRLAHQKAQAAAQTGADGVNGVAQIVQPFGLVRPA